jgi:hypothetical protein
MQYPEKYRFCNMILIYSNVLYSEILMLKNLLKFQMGLQNCNLYRQVVVSSDLTVLKTFVLKGFTVPIFERCCCCCCWWNKVFERKLTRASTKKGCRTDVCFERKKDSKFIGEKMHWTVRVKTSGEKQQNRSFILDTFLKRISFNFWFFSYLWYWWNIVN